MTAPPMGIGGIPSIFDDREPSVGPRYMTLSRQILCIGYVKAVVDAITENKLDARTLEALRRSGTYILTHPEQGDPNVSAASDDLAGRPEAERDRLREALAAWAKARDAFMQDEDTNAFGESALAFTFAENQLRELLENA